MVRPRQPAGPTPAARPARQPYAILEIGLNNQATPDQDLIRHSRVGGTKAHSALNARRGGPKGERSESSRYYKGMDARLRGHDEWIQSFPECYAKLGSLVSENPYNFPNVFLISLQNDVMCASDARQ